MKCNGMTIFAGVIPFGPFGERERTLSNGGLGYDLGLRGAGIGCRVGVWQIEWIKAGRPRKSWRAGVAT